MFTFVDRLIYSFIDIMDLISPRIDDLFMTSYRFPRTPQQITNFFISKFICSSHTAHCRSWHTPALLAAHL